MKLLLNCSQINRTIHFIIDHVLNQIENVNVQKIMQRFKMCVQCHVGVLTYVKMFDP